MKSLKDSYRLSNGVEIPCMGFGTWQVQNGSPAVAIIKEAISAGYRHIDTATGYGNEESVGIAVRESGVDRKDLFITSKLNNPDHGYQATMKAFEKTMERLDMDYLDLYLIHWPNPVMFRACWKEANAESWKAFEELYKAGSIRSIGISNFLPHHMDALLETAEIKPMVNQIRLCPGETQQKTVSYCRAHDMLLEAYSPLGKGSVMEVPQLKEISTRHGKSVAQVCLRWSLQMGFLPLPKSSTPARMKENADVFDFELSQEEMAVISGLKGVCGPTKDPDTVEF